MGPLPEFKVIARLPNGDLNLILTDSRERALLAFRIFYQNPAYSKTVVQVGTEIYNQDTLDRLPEGASK